jgi:hypothetical protein
MYQLPVDSSSELKSVVIPAEADVAGTLSASPSAVFLGTVSATVPPSREVLINCASAGEAKNVTLVSSAPWLKCSLGASIPSATGTSQIPLTLTLKNGVPVGPIHQTVTVFTKSGESLAIVVVGNVVP